MPGLTLESVIATTHEVKLESKLKQRLLRELRAYQAIQQQIATLEHAALKHKNAAAAIRAETGEKSIAVDGFKVTEVTANRKKFNPQRYVTLGGDLKLYNEAHDVVAAKPYDRITLPGASDDSE